ncbi:MAG: type IV pilus modification protein PilV [Curvibacter sp.]|nr:MAG: type IV pilus modification protein PilV [Curvibacter sp.]
MLRVGTIAGRSGSAPRSLAGFVLIEVLVSMFIVSVGLLGIAKMHALAIGNTEVAGSRALAAIYVGSLSSAMHANRAYWQEGTTWRRISVVGETLGDATLDAQNADCTYSVSNPSPQCTPVQMASADLKTWGRSLQQLPGGQGLVLCSNPFGQLATCMITVSWNERYVGLNPSTLDRSQQTVTQTYTSSVTP